MSNEYKDWLYDMKNSLPGTPEHNQWLCYKYPWLIPRNCWTGEIVKDYDYSLTQLDSMPEGWRKAFGLEMCEEIQKVLEKANYVDKYRILQIKEKWGFLCWYDNGVPEEIYNEYQAILTKYEGLSAQTCINCGAPATKISCGWISPWCDKCAEEYGRKTMDINEWLEES